MIVRTVTATSSSSERFFSQGALIISKTRNRLNKETFEKILCLKSWGIIDKDEEYKEYLERKKLVKDEEDIDFFYRAYRVIKYL